MTVLPQMPQVYMFFGGPPLPTSLRPRASKCGLRCTLLNLQRIAGWPQIRSELLIHHLYFMPMRRIHSCCDPPTSPGRTPDNT